MQKLIENWQFEHKNTVSQHFIRRNNKAVSVHKQNQVMSDKRQFCRNNLRNTHPCTGMRVEKNSAKRMTPVKLNHKLIKSQRIVIDI